MPSYEKTKTPVPIIIIRKFGVSAIVVIRS